MADETIPLESTTQGMAGVAQVLRRAGLVTVICDRCGRTVEGQEVEEGTAGFYVPGSPFAKYLKRHEQVVCDDCMHHALDYQEDYPPVEPPVETFAHAVLCDRDMTPEGKLRWLDSPDCPCVEPGWVDGLKALAARRQAKC